MLYREAKCSLSFRGGKTGAEKRGVTVEEFEMGSVDERRDNSLNKALGSCLDSSIKRRE